MTMIRFVLAGLVLFSTKVSSKSHLTKCCPPGEIFSGHSIVECVSVPRNATELYIQHWNTTTKFQGIPQCKEPEDLMTTPLDDLDSDNFLEVPACLEILHMQATGESTVIVVHCRSYKDRLIKAINASFPQLTYIRKCCPRDTVFDSRTKACVPQLSELDSLAAFLLNGLANADLVIIATFGVLRGSTITKAREHRKRFLLYCVYAWGLSLLVSIFAIVADSTKILPDYLQPNIGNRGCWFTQKRDSYGELTFFIGPVMILLISNIVFFILTSVHCNKVKAEIKRVTTDPTDPRSKRFRSDKKRFIMNIKLFIVMGMSWICEVVSFFLVKYLDYGHWHHVFFYTSDVFNCLQGLLIFILFVLKSRVYQALRRRLGFDTKKKKTTPANNATATLHDPYKVRKSTSDSTLTTFAISSTP